MADEAQAQAGPLGDAGAAETPDQRGARIYRSRMANMLAAFAVSLAVMLVMHWPWQVIIFPSAYTLGTAISGYLMGRKLPPGLGWFDFVLNTAMFTYCMHATARSWNACSLALHRHLGH